mmetsp:Transcript_5643/g.11027  ORF Transcript_5643/g.11027 Transcript_5643/m.11027 type:complete len:86 (+) Transcript_5643:3914-4171(+)
MYLCPCVVVTLNAKELAILPICRNVTFEYAAASESRGMLSSVLDISRSEIDMLLIALLLHAPQNYDMVMIPETRALAVVPCYAMP